MNVFSAISFYFSLLVFSCSVADAETVGFVGGRWFDGQSFVRRDAWSVDAVFQDKRPSGQLDREIDLDGGWVVPPFGEAHNHNLRRPPSDREVARYLNDGVLYVMIQNNLPPLASAPISPSLPLDILYANGGFTAAGGHVVEVYERLVQRGVMGDLSSEELDGLAYFVVETVEDLDRQWPRALRQEPDFIKIYLGVSEETQKRKSVAKWYGKRGLDPDLAREIVARAHEAGLRVSAHIETAADFRLALEIGVDLIAHLPGWRIGKDAGFEDADPKHWLIPEVDAARAARQRIAIVTTTLALGTAADPRKTHHAEIRDLHKRNLLTLINHGAYLVLGSDRFGGTSIAEALFLARQNVLKDALPLAVFDNLTLLKMLSETTPRWIFPDRKIGALGTGFEANFLVLEGNPIEDIANLRRIRSVYRTGTEVERPGE